MIKPIINSIDDWCDDDDDDDDTNAAVAVAVVVVITGCRFPRSDQIGRRNVEHEYLFPIVNFALFRNSQQPQQHSIISTF